LQDFIMNKANFFWSGNPLKEINVAVYNSFVSRGWDVTVWSYDPGSISLSPHIKVKDANEVLDISRLGTFSYENCDVNEVPFSDLFRLYVMQYTGGWWFDSDCFCLSDCYELQYIAQDKQYVAGWEFPGSVNNAVLYFQDKELLTNLILATEADIEPTMFWGKIGPKSLTNFLTSVNVADQALPSELFYPITWGEAAKATEDEHFEYVQNLCRNSLVYHYYNSICQWNTPKGYLGYLVSLYK
jgi:hypothetical protein